MIDITVVVELLNALSPREIVVSLGRSIHYQYTSVLPLTTNEEL